MENTINDLDLVIELIETNEDAAVVTDCAGCGACSNCSNAV